MPAFCVAFPVRPAKVPAVKDFCKEAWFLQGSPQGDLVLIYFEAKDFQPALVNFGRSQDPFDLWFKEEVKAYTGVDFSEPRPGPLPEQVLAFGYER